MRINAWLFASFLVSAPVRAQRPLPIIDMHLHARGGDFIAANPYPMCAPFEQMPYWDPKTQDRESGFSCKEPIFPAKTATEVMQQTIAVMQRRNIIGMISGEPELIAQWKAAAPERVIIGLDLKIGGGQKKLHVKSRSPAAESVRCTPRADSRCWAR